MERKDFTVRDQLAYDRTKMANERTILSYFRTFIGVEGAGAALIKLFNDVPETKIFATALFLMGPIILFFGISHFLKVKRDLKSYIEGE